MNPKLKAAVNYGPLLIFFVAFYTAGIMYATGAIIAATLVALGVSYGVERKLAPMPLVSGILITVFGGITLILQDPIYLILKTTTFYILASVALGVGLFLDKPLIKYVMGSGVRLPHEAWRHLTWRWIALFLFLAAVNVTVYSVWGLDVWVNFKVWGVIVIIFGFTMAQMPFIIKNQIEPETTE